VPAATNAGTVANAGASNTGNAPKPSAVARGGGLPPAPPQNAPVKPELVALGAASAERRYAEIAAKYKIDDAELTRLQKGTAALILKKEGSSVTVDQAKDIVKPHLERPFDETDPGNKSLCQAAAIYEGHLKQILKRYGLDKHTDPRHWYAKGMFLADNPTLRTECDGSTALAFYALCKNGGFQGHIAVVLMGELLGAKHWFVTANKAGGNTLDPGTNPGVWKGVVVDLWGRVFMKTRNRNFNAVQESPFVAIGGGQWTDKKNHCQVICSV